MITPRALGNTDDERKPVPLADEPEGEVNESVQSPAGEVEESAQNPAASVAPASQDGGRSPAFAERDNQDGTRTVRGVFALGGQLALASQRLEPATGFVGGGGRLNVGFAPATWPVLFGGSFDLVSYGTVRVTYDDLGRSTQSRVERLSHIGQVFVRLQPERYALRPFIDVAGGYWMLIYNQKLWARRDEERIKTLRVAATGCLSVGVGADWLFAEGPRLGNYGIGLDVRYTRGIGLPVADLSTATAQDGELTIPGRIRVRSPSQLIFTLSFVVASHKGNWAVGTTRVIVE